MFLPCFCRYKVNLEQSLERGRPHPDSRIKRTLFTPTLSAISAMESSREVMSIKTLINCHYLHHRVTVWSAVLGGDCKNKMVNQEPKIIWLPIELWSPAGFHTEGVGGGGSVVNASFKWGFSCSGCLEWLQNMSHRSVNANVRKSTAVWISE